MFYVWKLRRSALMILTAILLLSVCSVYIIAGKQHTKYVFHENGESYIKWVEFDIPSGLLKEALQMDVQSHQKQEAKPVNWIEVLAYLGTKYGGDFRKYKAADLAAVKQALQDGRTIAELAEGKKHYTYYLDSYMAVLGGFVGEYEQETEVDGKKVWKQAYGLKAFSPIAKGYAYSDYDDFGNSRSYGYKRKHLGHDFMALTGTPVIAVESGVVEVMGWNQYGGWRIGIRSFDGRRYHFYAHLRQNRPFAEGLETGQVVMAGDVIGYVGRTGYSTKENTNGIKQSHLHYGLQLIFDESQKEGSNQIWIDFYELSRFLRSNQTETVRNNETKEHTRKLGLREEIPDDRFVPTEDSAPEEPQEEQGNE